MHNQLAVIHWQRRLQELKDLIAAEETRFKCVPIRSGYNMC